MEDIFVSNLNIIDARIIKNLNIPFSKEKRKHLILTGKNGCGKTSLLLEVNKYLNGLLNGQLQNREQQISQLNIFKNALTSLESTPPNQNTAQQIANYKQNITNTENWLQNLGNVEITFSNNHLLWEKSNKGTFMIAFFDARRQAELRVPSGINKINLQKKYNPQQKANLDFIQYIVNLKADRSFARDSGEESIVSEIDNWFFEFQERLREIFNSPTLELKFDRKNYNFKITEEHKAPYELNTLSDGYSAIISIVSELLLRMEAHKAKSYEMEGLVLIDEIETHLHVELQKKILPFLTDFFPKIQFIISTHSPFVLSSVENVVICDLESKIITNDLTGYSYDALIESYFYSDKYSNLIKNKVEQYEKLSLKDKLSTEEKSTLNELEKYFSHTPKYLSNELLVKLQQISLKKLDIRG